MENDFNILFYYLVKVGECLKTTEGLHHYWLFRVNIGDILAACESNDKSKRAIIITDDSCIWDATEMAQLIENSDSFDIEGIYPFLSDELKQKVKNNPSAIEYGINENIVWIYDVKSDIHYFYRKL